MLKLSLGPDVSPMTGGHAALLELTNRSRGSCVVEGYPSIRLTHRARSLPFLYQHGGGYVTKNAPKHVMLASGRRAYFLVAKYRCDGKDLSTTTAVDVALPAHQGNLTLGLNQGEAGFGYCKRSPGDRPVDPGNRIDVSPVEAAAMAAAPAIP